MSDSCDPMDCSLPSSSVYGILQARVLECVAISSSRGSSQTRDQTHVSCISRWALYLWVTGETLYMDEYMCAYTCICSMCIFMYIAICVCMNICYICMFLCIYIYVHTQFTFSDIPFSFCFPAFWWWRTLEFMHFSLYAYSQSPW